MARYTGPTHRLCRREGVPICGNSRCPVLTRNTPPGAQGGRRARTGRRRKVSEYHMQLREKQKVRRMYGILERQFRRYIEQAQHARRATGVALLQLLEQRLDNVVYRLGFARTRQHARQMVTHGHVRVDGKRVTIPSFVVGQGQTIQVDEKTATNAHVKQALDERKEEHLPSWLQRKGPVGHMKGLPVREDVDQNIQEQLIVEYYSR